jgi:ACT domain-containing protein
METVNNNPLSCWRSDLPMRKTQPIMKKLIYKNSQLPFPGILTESRKSRWNFRRIEIKMIRALALALLLWLPMVVNAALTLPAIPSNASLAKRFELSTEMIFRVKVGETYLPNGALIAYINGEIRGAQTASVNFPATGNNVYKILVFNDKAGDQITFKYYDIFAEKIYDITEIIEFVPNQIPDYANPVILTAFCKPITIVTGLIPENGKENLNATLDVFWQPSPNTSYYKLFLWEDGSAMPATPTYSNINNTTIRLYNLKYGKLYHWKVGSVNDCSSVESSEQTFKIRQLPDLTVTEILAPANIESGSNFNISFKIKNIGVGNTAGIQWNDLVYASTDATFSNDDRLLSNTTNVKQLDPDSIYSRTVTVSFPLDYSGDCYFFVKTDNYNSVVELLETNNEAKTTNVSKVVLKTLPDILVKNIQPGSATVNPGDSLLVNWKVENTGGTTATGGWAERITIVPVSGLRITISPNTEYNLPLAVGSTISRSRKIKIPEIPRFSGDATIEVELFPYPELLEYAANKANNKAQSAEKFTIANILSLDVQTTSVLESTTAPIRCIVTRSGDYTADMVVNLAASLAGQLTFPATITIPANQSSIVFNLNTINNTILEGSRNVAITASATSYTNAVKSITILDDEVPSLSASLSKTSPTEGETITLTVSRDLVTNQALTVSISTNKAAQWTFPASVIIPANTASNTVSVVVTDDNIPELKSDAVIYASSAGVTTGQVTASIVDNDIPQVSLELLADTVSESAGVYATWGVIKRVSGLENITINLQAVPGNELYFPASIYLPKGAVEQKFNIGVIDNGNVDGDRKVTLSGSIYISSCNCGTTAENGGVVTANLTIIDNDGASLSVSINPISLPEGKLNAGNLTISRNTPTTDALAVTISHNDPTEVSIQTSATIPAGAKSVIVPINTINDNIEDGNQMVSFEVKAPTFSSGFGYVFVSDQNKPDLEITDIVLNKNTAATNETIEITGSAFNTGFATAPSGVKMNFYSSKDNTIDATDILLGEFVFPSPIPQNTAANFMKTVEVPDQTGNYFIIAKINPAEAITELVYFNNVSDALPLAITPEYNVTAIADNNLYMPNTTIQIHGSALNISSQKVPNVDVDVYILVSGTRRELKAKTDNLGDYTVDFVPNSNESGHYTIGACFPKQNLSIVQDQFDIPGILRESTANIIWEMKLGQILTGKIAIKNTSESALNQLIITPDKLPPGCVLKFDTIAVLAGNQTKEFSFTVKALEISSGRDYERINFQVKSSEGITYSFPAYYYCHALQAQLKSDPVSINTTMTKGKSRQYELSIYNNGDGETGIVTISLPNVTWMTLLTPATIANIASNDTAKVVLNLEPNDETPLNTPISGNIAINCVNGNGVSIPYRIEAVSEATGGLKVDVIDEYTYFTDAKPHVKNAHVVVRHPFSGKIMADGFTDVNGIFSVDNLPEGAYKMNVEAEKHEGFQTTLIIDPGRVNEQSVFLSFQAISYTWEVVPTVIEDKYEVQLVMKFETNVPVPVVVVEMPKDMPQLFNDETYPFLITMTNKGLITAKDVQLTLPQNDPEYIFLTNFSKLDLLAQQAIQVPVVMKRRDALKSANSTETTGPCTDYVVTIYGWECGKDKQWHQTANGITFKGRICTGTGGPVGGGGSWGPGYIAGPGGPGGGGSYHYDPGNGVPSISAPTIGCDKCLIDVAQAILGCVKLHPYVALAVNVAGCAYSAMDGIEFMDVFNCVISFTPAKYARDGYKCALGIANAAKTCYEDPPFFLKNATATKSAQISKMPPILQQSVHDLEAFLYGNNATNGIITEFMGSVDWDSKENFNDFVEQIKPFTSTLTPILPADLLLIQQNMAGTDITSIEISTFTTRWNSTLEAHAKNINSPTTEYPNIVDYNILLKYKQRLDSVQNYTITRGFTDVGDMYIKSMATIEEQIESGRNSVCASVTIQIKQKVVMTREAFEGTLTIFNGHTTTAMKEIKLNLEIRDENGVLSNDLFQINTKALSILTGIDGTGTLGAQEKGSATVLFIPEKGAAPTVPKSYSFGGSFSYLDPFTGVTVTKPLFPVTLDVNPSPDLFLHYFMQRDILGDDALTTSVVEPIVPAEFAVMIQNNGYGTAKNVRIESAQPEIIENEKGLAINFALIGSNLNGQPRQLGLTNIDFGNIAPLKATIGQWWFTSDLLGHFISYDAKVTHLDSYGNPDLSLISGATLHELIRSVRNYSGVEDNINDFLVNEVQDSKEFPDIIYLSNGGTLDVYPAVSQSSSGSISTGNHEIELIVTPKQEGWNYIKFSDPGNNVYKIASVTREDGQIIPLDNVWQTFVTLPDGKEPVYENMMHFLDVFAANTPQKYKIRFTAPAQSPPSIVQFQNVPTSFVTKPVTSINVVFDKPIDAATFNYQDMTLRVQGGADIMDNTVLVSAIDQTTYKIDLTSKSTLDGYYVLNVQTTGIKDLVGTNGVEGKQANWTQFIGIPAVSEFIGLPNNNVGAPFDVLLLRFNVPIDKSTVLPARFTWKKNGTAISGSVTVTEMDTEGLLFQLSGLQTFLSADGQYSLTVDLPNIKSLTGINGMLVQSVEWKIDQTAPLISKIEPSTIGGYDWQHRTAYIVLFNEPVKGFGVNSLELWKDGLRQPISQLDFTAKSDSEYLFTEFRMLTYYEGKYQLKVIMKDVSDLAGNSRTDTVKYNWIVNRALPKPVNGLRISPDMGFSDTDNITATKTLIAHMTVVEPNTQIKLYQTDKVNPILLADSSDVNSGPLALSVNFSYSGNLTLQAYCIDQYGNYSITEIPVFIDEAALVSTWKNAPPSSISIQPTSIQIEFSDKLLDDTKLLENLKFERDGQSLGTLNLSIVKSTDKLFVLSGMNQYGNAGGTYELILDLSKFKKYNSGKEGVSTSRVSWKIDSSNKAPNANAGFNQTVDENTLVTLDGSGSTDPNNDALTYLWTAPAGITLSSATAIKPTFTAPEVTTDQTLTFSLIVNDGKVNSTADEVVITIKNLGLPANQAQILNAQLVGADSTKVDQASMQVFLYLPYGTDIRALAPTFQISPKASIAPASGSTWNFTTPVSYTVTAEDGITKKNYSVKAFVPTVTLKRALAAGWNWISLSATPPDLNIGSVFGNLALANLDYIKTATTSAVYYTSTGWFGDLTNVPQFEMLKFKKSTSQIFTLSGNEINPSLVTVPVSTGWNRIGYILKGNAKLSEAFETASLPTGDLLLKSKEASAIYYPVSGWAGDLDSLRVLNGYMMKTASNANLKYNASGARLKSAQQSLFTRSELYNEYRINPPAYENSAIVIGELVNSNNENLISKGDLLIAYSKNEPRGVTEACFIPELNRYVFVLTLFSNSNQEKLNFKVKTLANSSEEAISDELIFKNDEVYGEAMKPYLLHLANPTGITQTMTDQSVLVYPNPVFEELHITSEDKILSVTVSGLSGNSIQILSNISEYTLLMNTRNLAPGMYMLKIETSKGEVVKKLIKSNK